jgi:hypothetical protein
MEVEDASRCLGKYLQCIELTHHRWQQNLVHRKTQARLGVGTRPWQSAEACGQVDLIRTI